MAASFGLAFALGIAYRDAGSVSRQATIDSSDSATDQSASIAKNDRPAAVPEEPEPDPWGEYVFAVSDGGPEREVQVPLYDGRNLDDQALADWLARQSEANRPGWLDALRRAGHEVRTRPGVAPLDLGDGQQALVPTLEVEIVPVGGSYQ
jgi:hypothetical protein